MTPSNANMRKQVTLNLEGYKIKDAIKALVTKVMNDFPDRTRSEQAKALGVTPTGLTGMLKRNGIKPQRTVSKAEMNAIALLKKRGYKIDMHGITVAPARRRMGKPTIWDPSKLEGIEKGQVISMPGLTMSTVKNYVGRWNQDQPEPMRFRYFQDKEGVKVQRMR